MTSYTTKNIKILNKKKMKTKPDSDNDTILYKDSDSHTFLQRSIEGGTKIKKVDIL